MTTEVIVENPAARQAQRRDVQIGDWFACLVAHNQTTFFVCVRDPSYPNSGKMFIEIHSGKKWILDDLSAPVTIHKKVTVTVE